MAIRSFKGWRSRIAEAINPPIRQPPPSSGPDPFRGLGGPEAPPQRKEIGDFVGSMNPPPEAGPTPYEPLHSSDRGGAVFPNPDRRTNWNARPR
jgi:hypothetical protein